MVDIIHIGLTVDQADEILDDFDDVFIGEHTHRRIGVEAELLVDTETAHIAEVVALVAEEKILNQFASRSIVGRVSVTHLTVDVGDSFLLGATCIFAEGVENDLVITCVHILFVKQNHACATFENLGSHFFCQNLIAVNKHFVTLNRNHFTGVFIHEVLVP